MSDKGRGPVWISSKRFVARLVDWRLDANNRQVSNPYVITSMVIVCFVFIALRLSLSGIKATPRQVCERQSKTFRLVKLWKRLNESEFKAVFGDSQKFFGRYVVLFVSKATSRKVGFVASESEAVYNFIVGTFAGEHYRKASVRVPSFPTARRLKCGERDMWLLF